MKTKTIFKETSDFILKKLLIGILSMLIMFVPAILLFGICRIFSSPAAVLGAVIGLIIGIKLKDLFDKYFGYMIKAAHIAVISEIIETGNIPDNQTEYGKSLVKANFAQANIYFVLDRLISKAVKQIQKKSGGLSEFIGNVIPFAESLINEFVKSSLDYIDECCIGYTFYRKDEKNKFKSSCDGIVLYFQNWKDLLKSSLKASLISVGATALVFIIITLIIGLLLKLFLEGTAAFTIAVIIGAVIAGSLKESVIDTYVYIEIMNSFLPYAINQEPDINLYDKFSKLSSSFNEMLHKSKENNEITL